MIKTRRIQNVSFQIDRTCEFVVDTYQFPVGQGPATVDIFLLKVHLAEGVVENIIHGNSIRSWIAGSGLIFLTHVHTQETTAAKEVVMNTECIPLVVDVANGIYSLKTDDTIGGPNENVAVN